MSADSVREDEFNRSNKPGQNWTKLFDTVLSATVFIQIRRNWTVIKCIENLYVYQMQTSLNNQYVLSIKNELLELSESHQNHIQIV